MIEKPVITHLGKVRGQWPVHAFTNAQQAAYWATAERPLYEVRYVWEVEDITLGEAMAGETIPERRVLEPVEKPESA